MPLDRPIPAFYCCYLLRSTVKHGSVYVGSTPNPVRRLKQHNGLAKGGAVRTARNTLRPWEMACIVTGFPSHIAALQFEWAWNNPHITSHIAPEDRISYAAGKKKSGQPKRPRHSVTSLLSNLHVLLRSVSFSRWPLELRFFAPDVHKTWTKWQAIVAEPIRESIPIIQDFPPSIDSSPLNDEGEDTTSPSSKGKRRKSAHGIAALPIDYTLSKPYVAKAKDIIDFEQEGSCAACKNELEHDVGIYAICPSPSCDAVTHLTCLSKHFLRDEGEETIVPIKGTCPKCETELRWDHVVKELTLRMRGQKEVEKLLKRKRVRKTKAGIAAQADAEIEIDSSESDDEEEDEIINSFNPSVPNQATTTDDWHIIEDSEGSEAESVASNALRADKLSPSRHQKVGLGIVIEDSDGDEALD